MAEDSSEPAQVSLVRALLLCPELRKISRRDRERRFFFAVVYVF